MNNERGYRRALFFMTVLLGIVLGLLSVLLMRYRELSAIVPISEAAGVISKNYYYYDQEAGEEALIDASLRGMVGSLEDVYAQYFTKEEYDALLADQSGSYIGLGIRMREPDETGSLIEQVYSGSPIELAGAQVGDYILSVNGTTLSGLSLDAATALFYVDSARADTLTLLRDGETFEISVTSAEIYVPYVQSRMINASIGYMQIEAFHGQVVSESEAAVKSLLEQGMQSLIIDLRGNPGGGLTEVLDVSDLFFQKGDLLVTIKSRIDDTEYYYAEDNGYTFPIVLLVDGGSASASELLAGAMQDHDRATIIGTQTYGKGIVQTYYRLNSNGGWVRITTDAYYSPNDVCIQGIGITPDIEVRLPEGIYFDPINPLPMEDDTQLQEAIRYLEN